jgi:hypothetical protein
VYNFILVGGPVTLEVNAAQLGCIGAAFKQFEEIRAVSDDARIVHMSHLMTVIMILVPCSWQSKYLMEVKRDHSHP